MSPTRTFYLPFILLLALWSWNLPLFGQVKPKEPRFGKDSLACTSHLDNLHTLYKAGKPAEAYPHWQWVSLNCPAASENSYVEAAAILESLIAAQKDSLKREALIDTLMNTFDQRIRNFKRPGYVLGRKGVKLYEYRPWKAKEAFAILKQSVGGDVYNSRPPVLVIYFKVTMDLFNQGKMDTLQVYEVYDELRTILDYNILKNTKESPLYQEAKDEIQKDYSAMSPCDDLDNQFAPLYVKDTANLAQTVSFIHEYEKKHCYGSRLYLYMIKRICDMKPSGETAVMTAGFFYNAGHYDYAKMYYEIAQKMSDSAAVYESYLRLSELYTDQYRDYASSFIQLEEAIKYRPDKSAAYLAFGDLCSKSFPDCQSTELQRRALFWVAADQYAKAKSVDPSVSRLADEKLRACEKEFPTKAMIRENNLTESDPFSVTCWLPKTTTVRARP